MSAQVFDYVVAADGSGTHTTIQSAINACPDNVRKTIFVKNGTYREKVYIGSHSVTSNKIISLIGENADSVLIVWNDYNGKLIYYYTSTSQTTCGTPQSATFTVNAKDFYAENLTIKNEYTAAQAVALYNVADRQTFKNCKIVGYQDTHYLKKGRRSYYLNCYIEGATDYICAGGTAIYEGCTLKSIRNGSYITAPEDITTYVSVGSKKYYHGFVFRNCELTSDDGIVVYLGRPWQPTSSSVYVNCKMKNIKPEGWSVWSGNSNHLSSFFAEYNSTDFSGNLVDISNRVSWSYQLTLEEVDTYYSNTSIYSHVADVYDPVSLCTTLGKPVNLSLSSGLLSWDSIVDAIGYVVYRDGVVVGFTTSNSFADANIRSGIQYGYKIRSVKTTGAMSEASDLFEVSFTSSGMNNPFSSIMKTKLVGKSIHVSSISDIVVYNLTGRMIGQKKSTYKYDLSGFAEGVYIVKSTDNVGNVSVLKIVL